ncbi:MAG: hypothetical protein ACO3AY_08285, partial [Chitinophagaceae bacterium]
MTLTKIWAAFILIAFSVGAFRMADGDEKIFTRMVTGKSSDKYDSVFYVGLGDPVNMGLAANYSDWLKDYGFYQTEDPSKAHYLLTDTRDAQSQKMLINQFPQLEVQNYIQ